VHTDVREAATNKMSRGNFVTGPLILAWKSLAEDKNKVLAELHVQERGTNKSHMNDTKRAKGNYIHLKTPSIAQYCSTSMYQLL